LKPIVDHPRKFRLYTLTVDASTGISKNNSGLGALLCQTDKNGEEQAILYVSRQLLTHKKNYTLFLVKMQAMV
jgi:hypothetical protein